MVARACAAGSSRRPAPAASKRHRAKVGGPRPVSSRPSSRPKDAPWSLMGRVELHTKMRELHPSTPQKNAGLQSPEPRTEAMEEDHQAVQAEDPVAAAGDALPPASGLAARPAARAGRYESLLPRADALRAAHGIKTKGGRKKTPTAQVRGSCRPAICLLPFEPRLARRCCRAAPAWRRSSTSTTTGLLRRTDFARRPRTLAAKTRRRSAPRKRRFSSCKSPAGRSKRLPRRDRDAHHVPNCTFLIFFSAPQAHGYGDMVRTMTDALRESNERAVGRQRSADVATQVSQRLQELLARYA